MDKFDAISNIALNIKFSNYCFKVARGNDMYKDLYQYCFLKMLEMPDGKFKRFKDHNELPFYMMRIAYLSWNSKTSPFYKENISFTNSTDDKVICYVEDKDEYTEELIIRISKVIEADLNDVAKKKRIPVANILFNEWRELGDYRSVAKKFNLPLMTVHKIISDYKQMIKCKSKF